jgi:class 3 adenylate cyclase
MSAQDRAHPDVEPDPAREGSIFGTGGSSTDLVIPGFEGLDVNKLGLTQIIQLQNHLSRVLRHKFQRERALAFTDIVGSTAYFHQYGNEAGRRLVQRHLDLVSSAVKRVGGRIVDTAGDGTLTCFPSVESGAAALMDIQKRNARANESQPKDHRLRIRAGLHFGAVLTDDVFVTGDPVNFCARVSSGAESGEIRVSGDAFRALPPRVRVRCRVLPRATYKGIAGEWDQWLLVWQEQGRAPRRFRIEETNQEAPLPDRDVVRFGRLAEIDGHAANDVILDLPDPALRQKISRWHFELERAEDGGRLLRQGSGQLTEVDGVSVPKGGSAPVVAGSVVRIGGVLTIRFMGDEPTSDPPDGETLI